MSNTELDDDKLDLSAWEAPDPPDGLADDVIARMGGMGRAPSVPESAPPKRSRTWLIAGIAAACLAATVGTYAFIRRGTQYMGPASGSVIAERARTVSLGPTRVELDPNSRVKWERHGNEIIVEQAAGAAAWRVGGSDRVVIDAGGSVSSIEASGASLRVEVKMNQADARIVGGAAITAAVVSLVSVVVYEGYVKVSGSKGQPTVIVQPGSTYTVAPPPPTVEQPVVGASTDQPERKFDPDAPTLADVRLAAGETAMIHATSAPVLVEIDTPDGCTLKVDDEAQSSNTFELSAGSHDYVADCGETVTSPTSGTLHVVLDDFGREILSTTPPVNKINADGRVYRISFMDEVPAIEVGGGTGKLHVSRFGAERTFNTNRIETGQLEPGPYEIWFDEGGKKTDLVLSIDESVPILYLSDVRWSQDQTQITGKALAHSALTVKSLSVPLLTDGRFMLGVGVGDVTTLRIEHQHRGIHYFVLRAPKRVATGPAALKVQLDAASITKVMTAANKRLQACGDMATSATHGKVVVEVTVAASGAVTSVVAKNSYDSGVSDCVVEVIKKLSFPKAQKGMTFSFPLLINNGKPACDAQSYHDKAIENMNLGQHAAALAQIEAALRCKPADQQYIQIAFASACNAQNPAKAKQYYGKLTAAGQTKFAQICIRNNVEYRGGVGCDAELTKEEGMKAINEGDHAKALQKFEESLDCKPDPYVVQLAFMEACNSVNETKAKEYWGQLSAASKKKFKTVCERNKVELDDDSGSGTAQPSSGSGYLQIMSKPAARILIDGVDTKLVTPVTGRQLPLSPGKHKVTFVIDDDRFTYPVVIKAGSTETMSKDLQ